MLSGFRETIAMFATVTWKYGKINYFWSSHWNQLHWCISSYEIHHAISIQDFDKEQGGKEDRNMEAFEPWGSRVNLPSCTAAHCPLLWMAPWRQIYVGPAPKGPGYVSLNVTRLYFNVIREKWEKAAVDTTDVRCSNQCTWQNFHVILMCTPRQIEARL